MRRRARPTSELAHRWYLAEWAKLRGKTQADAQRELGWPKSNASYLFNGNQRYTQDHIDQVSKWLGVEAYELLMRPEDARALQSLRSAIAAFGTTRDGR